MQIYEFGAEQMVRRLEERAEKREQRSQIKKRYSLSDCSLLASLL
jgi:hypothetical protein